MGIDLSLDIKEPVFRPLKANPVDECLNHVLLWLRHIKFRAIELEEAVIHLFKVVPIIFQTMGAKRYLVKVDMV
jgi:hypothetical protein